MSETLVSHRPQLAANYYLAPPSVSVVDFMSYAKQAGAEGVGLTLTALEAHEPEELAHLAAEHNLFISSLNSAGYFLFSDPLRRDRQRELNKVLIDAAARMRAGRLVVITGGIIGSGLNLEAARARGVDALAALDTEAGSAGVRLALEPIHPADLTTKGCINSIRQALDIVRPLSSTDIVIDVFHSAWDPDIWSEAVLSDRKLALVQACDWFEPGPDEKPQRELPPLGLMDLRTWLGAVKASGYVGPIEFEMFDRHRRGREVSAILTEALGFFNKAIES